MTQTAEERTRSGLGSWPSAGACKAGYEELLLAETIRDPGEVSSPFCISVASGAEDGVRLAQLLFNIQKKLQVGNGTVNKMLSQGLLYKRRLKGWTNWLKVRGSLGDT